VRPPGPLATLLRTHRETAGLTQRQLADRAGISVGALQDLEQGRTIRPRQQSLAHLAVALQLSEPQREELVGASTAEVSAPPGQRDQTELGSSGLRLQVLGPLAAWRGRLPVALGPVRQRAVLGLLAMHADTSFSRAAIVDALWGNDPPPTSAAMIQGQVSRIRRLLGLGAVPGDDARLSWDGSGYRLRLGGVRLDAAEFSELTEHARQTAAAGDAAAACGLYERALSLWRGRALEDVGVLRGHPAVTGLGRWRDAVVIEYAGVAARTGRHDRVVAHLEALAAREPLDERAHAQLMVALAATGRQAAALRIYQDLAERLGNDLGVRPGPELSAAHLQVLRQQFPSAGPSAAGKGESAPAARSGRDRRRAAADRVVPRQLPGAVPRFVGRAAELAVLTSLLDQAARAGGTVVISAIGGTAGVGKTALALHWAHQVASQFPGGQLHVNLRGFGPSAPPVTATEAVRLLLDGLGVAPDRIPAGLDAQAALYRSLLAGQKMLIVLDNARDPAQVRPLLPGAPGCLVLVTSRNQFTGLAAGEGAHLITLDVLTEAQAHELLAQRLGPGRVAGEPAPVTELIGLCARLPLALSIVAAQAAAQPALSLAALAAELRGAGARLDSLGTGDDATDIRRVFSWSGQQLGGPAARMFRLLGVHPGPDLTVPAAASLAGLPPARARQALTELSQAHLITEHTPGRYAFHDLLRAYAAEQAMAAESEAGRRAAAHRLLDHYLHTACAASLLLQPHRDPISLEPPRPGVQPEVLAGRQEALEWFQAERQVLLAVISQAAADTAFGAHAWQLPWAVATFLNWHGYWHELVATQETALAVTARLGDRAGQAEAHRYLGQAQTRFGAYAEASSHLMQALELYSQLGSTARQARAHLDLGHVCEVQGRGRDALGHAEQSLRLYRAAGNRSGEANALNAVGWLHAQLGAFQEALSYCGSALAVHGEVGSRTGAAVALDSLGYAHHHLDNHAEAIACYQQAVAALGDADDLHLRAEVLARLGDAHQAAGNHEAARSAWQEALAILEDLHHPDADQVRSRLGGPAQAAQ
jgi:DNA-binding SARP family transcriptional activator/DNA-binding XRE family transcriptional regulator